MRTPRGAGPRLVRIDDVKHVRLEFVEAQAFDATLEAGWVVQSLISTARPAPFVLRDERLQAVAQVGGAARGQAAQELEHLEMRALPRVVGMRATSSSLTATMSRDPGWRDRRKRGPHTTALPARICRRCERHRARAIHDEVELRSSSSSYRRTTSVRSADTRSSRRSEVVPGHVVSVIGELDAAALLLRAALGAHVASEHTPAHDRESLSLRWKFVVEQRLPGCARAGPAGAPASRV